MRESVSTRLRPGDTQTATMLLRCTRALTTGTELVPSCVFGTWGLGRASSIRCRCRVRMTVRRDRKPSSRNNDLDDDDDDDVVKWVNEGSNTLDVRREAAAAA